MQTLSPFLEKLPYFFLSQWDWNSKQLTHRYLLMKHSLSSFIDLCMHTKSLQSCPTLCDPMDSSPPGSSAHGISQARILEWVAISFSRGSSWPRDRTCISCIGEQALYSWAAREQGKHRLKRDPGHSQRPQAPSCLSQQLPTPWR